MFVDIQIPLTFASRLKKYSSFKITAKQNNKRRFEFSKHFNQALKDEIKKYFSKIFGGVENVITFAVRLKNKRS